jgi:hypothetical protein
MVTKPVSVTQTNPTLLPRVPSPLFVAIGSALLIVAAVLLYQPALRVGLLSDDYALLMWARRLELMPRDWGQIRPLPIIVWWLLAQATAPIRTPIALHTLNVGLHGLNACLVWALARRFTTSPLSAFAAALLFLTMPVSVEAVAWASGVFDVMLTTLTLTMGLVATSRQDLRVVDQGFCLLLTVAMFVTKETGVIAGPMLLLLSWTRWGRLTRSAAVTSGLQLLLAIAYVATRQLTDRLDQRLTPRPDLQALERLVSGIGRAFVLPLHRDVMQAHPLVAALVGVGIGFVIAIWVVRCRRSPQAVRLAVLSGVGMLLCVAPAMRLFGITPDLQGTRYVYLASAWWSMALAAALLDGWHSSALRITAIAAALIAVVGAAALTRLHLQPWTTARTVRDRVLLQIISVPPTCRQVAAAGVPDNVDGAYVFRNGLNEALATLGRSYQWVEVESAAPECRVNIVF